MQLTNVDYFDYVRWNNILHKVTPESEYLAIPNDVLEYISDEIIILPVECEVPETSDSEWMCDVEDDSEETVQPEFPEFSSKVQDIISRLGGSCYIKTNHCSPKDAFWITAGQTLKVRDLTDFYQLIKASSIVKDDLKKTASKFHQCIIVFKKWMDIHPGTEFRCFVQNRSLIAISPREWPQYHDHFRNQRTEIINDIVSLFKENIKNTFPMQNYCFDVVRSQKDSVYILDFSPFGPETDSLAFDWEDLQSNHELEADTISEDDPEFRYLNEDIGIQPNKRNNFGVPKDIIDMFKSSSEADAATDDLHNAVVGNSSSISLNDFILNFSNHMDNQRRNN